MPIAPRPISARHLAATAALQEQPAHPKPKLTEPEIAALYNGCRYSNVVVPREPFWHWLPTAARAA